MASSRRGIKRSADPEAKATLSAKKLKTDTDSPNSKNTKDKQIPAESKTQSSEDNIAIICEAATCITKTLLGYGADNNWPDLVQNEGRSWVAGDYARNWLYISAKDRLALSGTHEEKTPKGQTNRFFYHSPFAEEPYPISARHKKANQSARIATGAVLAHSGSCDEHAHTLGTLLRELLPVGTPINICHFKSHTAEIMDFDHTFVVIGNVQDELRDDDSVNIENQKHNDNLLVVDAWPTQGGAIALKDFLFRKEVQNDQYLHVQTTILADGKDHLMKRVLKQKKLLHASDVTFTQSGPDAPEHHALADQKNITQQIKPYSLDEIRKSDGTYTSRTIADNYQMHPETKAKIQEILQTHPLLKQEIDSIQTELQSAGVKRRLGTNL